MKLSIYLDEHDKGTPIEFADAVIKCHIPDGDNYATEEDWETAHERLAEISEHIKVYLRHNRVLGYSGEEK